MDEQNIKNRFGIIGFSEGLNRAIRKAMQVAPTDITTLIAGESGTGKEAIPKIIHQLSLRKHKSFIPVNCGAIPDGTIDSELFGHEKGAFTGATGARKGYFEEADGGTIFLDEVAELPLATQVRLLRVLETGEFIRVGSSKIQKTDVRIVAASHVNLFEAVQKGKFREDLFYRLNTMQITLPPLRERGNDIGLLFRKFASDFASKYRMPTVRLTPDALSVLHQYNWPGNIRQLRNVVEQLSVVQENRMIDAPTLQSFLPNYSASKNELVVKNPEDSFSEREILYKVLFDMKKDLAELKNLTVDLLKKGYSQDFANDHAQTIQKLNEETHLATSNTGLLQIAQAQEVAPRTEETTIDSFSYTTEEPSFSAEKEYFEEPIQDAEEESLSIQEMEIRLIKKALEKHKGKRREAAKELDISERTLYRKIKQYDL
ncbi:MAG: sigma 54-interacting transcriptional regulator [Flavobacteriales bacterium]|jgi:transcriptional regulator with PAS, ATPase and Fis domain|nr:sigma 54-interacting transcriptional regulator [Flavobacteriales bacterium]